MDDCLPTKEHRSGSELRNRASFNYEGEIKEEFFNTTYGGSFRNSLKASIKHIPYPDPQGYVIGFWKYLLLFI